MKGRRLGPLDALFLAAETPRTRLHVMAVIVLDPATVPGGYRFRKLRGHIEDHLPLIPPLRRRLVSVPLGIDRPVWVEEHDVDVRQHVRRAKLPRPVGPRALAAFAAALDEQPLDRDRPLWEMHVVEGLDDGHVAIVAKLHHALMDGMAGMEFMASLFSLAPKAPEPPLPVPPVVRAPPGPWSLVLGAVPNLALLPLRSVRAGVVGMGALARVGRLLAFGSDSGPGAFPLATSRTVLNGPDSGRRGIAYTAVPLSDVKNVARTLGVSVNDVVMAMVGGGLRAYLARRHLLPERALVSSVPVSVRSDGSADRANAVSLVFASLATDVKDPVTRLLAVHDGMEAAKRMQEALGPDTIAELVDAVPPIVVSLAARLYAALGERLPAACDVLISNVPGPPVALYLAGARIVALHPLGPIFPGMGLNVTVVSQEDSVGFGAVTDPEQIHDPWELVAGFGDELARLVKAAKKAT